MIELDVGDEARARCRFTDTDSGDLVDPGEVVCRLIDPAGVAAAVSTSKVSTGIYEVVFPITLSGIYKGKMYGLKSHRAAEPFSVRGKSNEVPLPAAP